MLLILRLQIFISLLNNYQNKEKISFNDLNLKIVNKNKLLLRLENVFFSNFGYKKNSIVGAIFEKKI